jgi:xylulokinase
MENHLGASGAALKWLRNALFPALPYAELDEQAQKIGPGSNGVVFIPGLDENCGGFSGLSLNTTQADLMRAVLEGVAFGIRRCVEAQKELSCTASEQQVNQLRGFGGGAGSKLWCQILADVLGMSVVLPRTQETSNLGAAICAGLALGQFPLPAELAEFIGGPKLSFAPNPANADIYEPAYRKFILLEGVKYG